MPYSLKKKMKAFSVQCSAHSRKAKGFGRFPGFALILPVTAKGMKMSMGHWCNDIQGKTAVLGRKPSDTIFRTNVT
jgi:hypothetical protein